MLRRFTDREGGEGRAPNKAGSEIVERRGWRKCEWGVGSGERRWGRQGCCWALRTGVFQEVKGKAAGEDNGSLGGRRRKAGKQGCTGREQEGWSTADKDAGDTKNSLRKSSSPGKASRKGDEGSSCGVWEVSLPFRI